MSKKCIAALAAASCLALAVPAVAQSQGNGPVSEATRAQMLLDYQGPEYALGWRLWAQGIPSAFVSLFAHLQPTGVLGTAGPATGPEFTYRHNSVEVGLSLMYVDYSTSLGPLYVRGNSDPDQLTEQITSSLYGMYFMAHFLYGIQVHRMVEIQLGGGFGLGGLVGDLRRSEAFPNASGGWSDCVTPGNPAGASGGYCQGPNNHYSGNNYTEANWLGGGYVPQPIPWLSIPEVAIHIRPHRHFDLKIEGGWGLITLYGGISMHYVF